MPQLKFSPRKVHFHGPPTVDGFFLHWGGQVLLRLLSETKGLAERLSPDLSPC